MLFFLIFSSFSVPIERYQCGANINGHLFDITELANGRKNGFDIIRLANNDRYYFKMCSSLSNDDLPQLAPDATDISVMRCNYSSHKCASAIPMQSFDWKLINPNNADEGVIYFAAGEPFIDPEDKQFYTIDFEIQFKCDPNIKATDINYTYQIDSASNEVIVRITFVTAYGCPQTVPAPSPTPEFNPDCQFAYYSLPMFHYGIFTDFKLLNGGPYGVRTPLNVTEPDGEKECVLFYQPCERMKCPLNYTCNCTDSNYSSAWLCNKDNRVCQSYGLISDDGIDAEIAHHIPESPIKLTHHLTNANTGKSILLTVGCNRQYEYDHFNFTTNATISSENQLSVKSTTHDACYGYNPKPIPPFSEDICVVSRSSFGQINLSSLNQADGYNATVFDNNKTTGRQSTLYYQPCGGLNCPSGAQCDGDTNATVWLCDNALGYEDCIAYGLLENNMTYIGVSKYLVVKYTGDRKRTANVEFKCDPHLANDTIRLPETVDLYGTRLSFVVYSSRFCLNESSKRSISGGAIFLIILSIAIILYLTIAIIIGYVKTGRIEPPNKEFWTEFFACVSTAFLYIFKCGKSSASLQSKYDAI